MPKTYFGEKGTRGQEALHFVYEKIFAKFYLFLSKVSQLKKNTKKKNLVLSKPENLCKVLLVSGVESVSRREILT